MGSILPEGKHRSMQKVALLATGNGYSENGIVVDVDLLFKLFNRHRKQRKHDDAL